MASKDEIENIEAAESCLNFIEKTIKSVKKSVEEEETSLDNKTKKPDDARITIEANARTLEALKRNLAAIQKSLKDDDAVESETHSIETIAANRVKDCASNIEGLLSDSSVKETLNGVGKSDAVSKDNRESPVVGETSKKYVDIGARPILIKRRILGAGDQQENVTMSENGDGTIVSEKAGKKSKATWNTILRTKYTKRKIANEAEAIRESDNRSHKLTDGQTHHSNGKSTQIKESFEEILNEAESICERDNRSCNLTNGKTQQSNGNSTENKEIPNEAESIYNTGTSRHYPTIGKSQQANGASPQFDESFKEIANEAEAIFERDNESHYLTNGESQPANGTTPQVDESFEEIGKEFINCYKNLDMEGMDNPLNAMLFSEQLVEYVLNKLGYAWPCVDGARTLPKESCSTRFSKIIGEAMLAIIDSNVWRIADCFKQLMDKNVHTLESFKTEVCITAAFYFLEGYSHSNFLIYAAQLSGLSAFYFASGNTQIADASAQVLAYILNYYIYQLCFSPAYDWFNLHLEAQKLRNEIQEGKIEFVEPFEIPVQ